MAPSWTSNLKTTISTVKGDGNNVQELWRHLSPRSTRMFEFLEMINKNYGLNLTEHDYAKLQSWSTEHIASFWKEVWHFTGVKASKQYVQVTRTDLAKPYICLT